MIKSDEVGRFFRHPRRYPSLIFLLFLVAASCYNKADRGTHNGWLKGTSDERLNQIEKQLRGLDVAMVETGYRFAELYFAGKDGNWQHAKYQAEKIDTTINLGLERRPKRAKSAQPFLKEDLPAVLEAIKKKNKALFQERMERLRTACMKCHTAENVPFFTVEFPEQRASSIRSSR